RNVDIRRVLVGEHLRDRRRQRRLAVVDVTDRSDVDVRLGPLELGLGHFVVLLRTVLTWVSYGFRLGRRRWSPSGAGSPRRDGPVSERVGAHSPLLFWTISSATAFGTSA